MKSKKTDEEVKPVHRRPEHHEKPLTEIHQTIRNEVENIVAAQKAEHVAVREEMLRKAEEDAAQIRKDRKDKEERGLRATISAKEVLNKAELDAIQKEEEARRLAEQEQALKKNGKRGRSTKKKLLNQFGAAQKAKVDQ